VSHLYTTVPTGTNAPVASARLRSDLLAAQLPDGGWPAYSGKPANTESTAFASLSLAGRRSTSSEVESSSAAAERGFSWLAQRQEADGGWPVSDQVPGSTWTTAPVVLALAVLGRNEEQVRRGAAWLVARKGTGDPLIARFVRWVRRAEDPREVIELDPGIPGWPWVDGTFSWVEPTALATLALRAALARVTVADVDTANGRVREAVRWFMDRMSPGGGWNYGNRRVLGQDVEPYPDTTAWALLALRGAADAEVTRTSLARLDALMGKNRSALPRALAALAARAHGQNAEAMTDLLASQCAGHSGDTPPGDTRTRALALLALDGPVLPFHVT
jgi:Prenyltransferase and squalene oxidase repeat